MVVKHMLQRTATDRVFHALGDSTRRSILELLTGGPLSASEIAARLPVSLTAVGQHLHVLEESELIRTTKVGRVRSCELRTEGLVPISEWIAARTNRWERRAGAPGARSRRRLKYTIQCTDGPQPVAERLVGMVGPLVGVDLAPTGIPMHEGLARDLELLLDRRRVLRWMGAAACFPFFACTERESVGATCARIPEETAGPVSGGRGQWTERSRVPGDRP